MTRLCGDGSTGPSTATRSTSPRRDESPPNLRNSPWLVARYGEKSDRRRGLIVFRNPQKPGHDARDVAEEARPNLEAGGFGNFSLQDTMLGDMPAARLDFDRRDAGRIWAVREYFVALETVHLTFGSGTSTPEDDGALFASSFRPF